MSLEVKNKPKTKKRRRVENHYDLDETVAALLNKARSDYNVAKFLLEHHYDRYFGDAICFHCHQCVEKSLKAFLIFNKVIFPETHDLFILMGLCSEFRFRNFNLSEFSDFGINILYEPCSPSIDEARRALKTAQIVREYAENSIVFPISHTQKRIKKWKEQANTMPASY